MLLPVVSRKAASWSRFTITTAARGVSFTSRMNSSQRW